MRSNAWNMIRNKKMRCVVNIRGQGPMEFRGVEAARAKLSEKFSGKVHFGQVAFIDGDGFASVEIKGKIIGHAFFCAARAPVGAGVVNHNPPPRD